MTRKKSDYTKWIGIAITAVSFVSACSVAFYQLGELRKSVDELKKPVWETKAFTIKQELTNNYFVDVLADLKLSVRELEKRR